MEGRAGAERVQVCNCPRGTTIALFVYIACDGWLSVCDGFFPCSCLQPWSWMH